MERNDLMISGSEGSILSKIAAQLMQAGCDVELQSEVKYYVKPSLDLGVLPNGNGLLVSSISVSCEFGLKRTNRVICKLDET